VFERLEWLDDRVLLDGIVFFIEQSNGNPAADSRDGFRFYKTKWLLNEYERLFRAYPQEPANVLELGIWDGGSLALWFECLKPKKLVGVDLKARVDSPYFNRYVEERAVDGRIKTYWRTNQADAEAVLSIVDREFDGPLDIVFDDASHLYSPTKASFEMLFPRIRPGGMYIIEDWAWKHWRQFTPHPSWVDDRTPTPLVVELTELLGTTQGVIQTVCAYRGFVAIQRGDKPIPLPFRLEDHIFRRERTALRSLYHRLFATPQNVARRVRGRLQRVVRG
jgi:hypothetical protein